MNQFIDDFYDVLFKPALGIGRVVRERNVWHGLLIYLVVSLISSITAFSAGDPEGLAAEFSQIMPLETATALVQAWPLLNLFLVFALAPVMLFLSAAILQFSSELLGGQGRGVQLATGFGYAQLPHLLIAPFGLAARYLAFDIVGLVGFVAFIWSLVLKIETIHAAQGFSRRRATLAYFLPALVIAAAFIFLLLLLGSFLMPLLSELVPLQ